MLYSNTNININNAKAASHTTESREIKEAQCNIDVK